MESRLRVGKFGGEGEAAGEGTAAEGDRVGAGEAWPGWPACPAPAQPVSMAAMSTMPATGRFKAALLLRALGERRAGGSPRSPLVAPRTGSPTSRGAALVQGKA